MISECMTNTLFSMFKMKQSEKVDFMTRVHVEIDYLLWKWLNNCLYKGHVKKTTQTRENRNKSPFEHFLFEWTTKEQQKGKSINSIGWLTVRGRKSMWAIFMCAVHFLLLSSLFLMLVISLVKWEQLPRRMIQQKKIE